MDYGYATTTNYSAGGGANGGGFVPGGSQTDSPSGKRSYGKDTLRPVTIKQLIEAHHPNPDAEYFIIDSNETTQVTFVGQIRNISTQTTNVTYKLDDGTGTIEVKVWIDSDAEEGSEKKQKLVEQGYARVYGRLKAFANKRHVGANIIRPIQDYNEIQYHLLEATAVHLHFSRGPLENNQTKAITNGAHQQQQNGGAGGNGIPAGLSRNATRILQAMKDTEQTNEGLHVQEIASRTGLEVGEVMKAGEGLQNDGLIYTTVDDLTWAVLSLDEQ